MTDPIFKAPPVQAPTFTPQTTEQKTPKTQGQGTPVPNVPQEAQHPESSQQATAVPPTQPVPSEQNVSGQKGNDFQQKLRENLLKLKGPEIKEKIQHYLWYVLGGCFVLGMMFGCSMGGGSKTQQPIQKKSSGMEAFIVPNPSIRKNYPRCGRTSSKTDECIFFILNSDVREHMAEDFFPDVMKKMNRSEFELDQANSMYAKTLIPEGYFAMIFVPKS